MLAHATMSYGVEHLDGVDLAIPSPGSPPGMSSSKSSKASSLRSFNSDEDDCVTTDVGHFEEIGLDDDALPITPTHFRDMQQMAKSNPNPYSANFASELRAANPKHVGPKVHARPRDVSRMRPQRDIINHTKIRPTAPSLTTQFRDMNTHNLGTMSAGSGLRKSPLPNRSLSVRSTSSTRTSHRRRSPSPGFPFPSLSPQESVGSIPSRRTSWQSNREPRSVVDIEKECDDDDDDNIPDDLILDNVPLSPRPPAERPASRPVSASNSPERQPKERVRSVGNGTPPVAVHRGSLRSPSWKSEPAVSPPVKGRAKSWNAVISELSAEAKALTAKLEEHADELDKHGIYHSTYDRPNMKPRVKSALAELPPLRRTNIMIDPLPVSKEKEAVLSRTRPSWLPPKDPAEEKRHLREYQRMMVSSMQADKKREAARKEKETSKEKAANALVRAWDDVLGRWDDAIRERRTRELWWKGVAPHHRGTVWSRAIGNALGLTQASFQAALARAREVEDRVAKGQASIEDERRMAWFTQIKTDVEERTWAELKIFQAGAPLHQSLVDILRAYSMYRSDIGYVSGCHTIAALLLLNLSTPNAAFIALANILNRSLPLSFFASDAGAQASACNLVHQSLAAKSPKLDQHLRKRDLGLDPYAYLNSIFTSLFTQHLSLDECTRLWDVYVFEGDSVLIRAAVALLLDREMTLLGANTPAEVRSTLEVGSMKSTVLGKDDEWIIKVRAAGKV
ncbi:hypothetical protein F4775DRAFT_80703 [Biscogniauxia sp. FL1348]|nr:hypothetical protein F4775DRAFT_80703 [Biscogniauxia sp. FL1348]